MKPIQRDSTAAKGATSLLAVTFVIIVGLVGCSTIVLTATQEVLVPLALCGTLFAILGWICFRMVVSSDKPVGERTLSWLWHHRSEKARVSYQLKKIHRITPESIAPRQPPSVESLRDAKETFARWVPASQGRNADSKPGALPPGSLPRRKDTHGKR
jgi:hypothetical protein